MIECNIDIGENSRSNNHSHTDTESVFPFVLDNAGEFYAGDKYYTKRDGLDNYLLIVTEQGYGQMRVKRKSCSLGPGSAVVINCNMYQEYNTAPGCSWHFHYIHFTAATADGYGILLDELTPVTLRNPDETYAMMNLLYSLSYNSGQKNNAVISNTISGILTEMICSLEDYSDCSFTYRKDIDNLQNFIRNNFDQELHINDFANQTHLSQYYLIHLFRRYTGFTPYKYLHICRNERAQTLLVSTDMTISDIAESCGYNSAAVFIRHFKSFNKVSPGEYRRNFLYNLP